MPVEFLSEEQKQNYAQFSYELSPEELSKYFMLDDNDKINIDSEKILLYTAKKTIWNHKKEICKLYGYTEFHEQPFHWRFVRWLYNCFWYTNERTSNIFEKAVSRCLSLKILLPGI